MLSSLFIIILTIVSVLLGGILPLVERKFLSLTQRRVGPWYVGYRGRLQFLADALKLFLKEFIFLNNTNSVQVVLLPLIFFNINLFILLFLVWDNNLTLFEVEYSIVQLFILLTVCSVIISFVGIILKNKYTKVSSTRSANMLICFDITTSIFLTNLIAINGHFNFLAGHTMRDMLVPAIVFLPLILQLFIIYLIDVGRAPFDLVEAETEIIMGYNNEYSGFLFAIFILGEYKHILIFSYLFSVILF